MDSKRFRRICVVSVILALAAAVGSSVVWSGEDEEDASLMATIEGRIEEAEYDADGGIVSVYLWDPEYGDVLISREKRGRELMKLVGSVVQATGRLRALDEDAEYDYVMDVEAYEVIDESEE